MSGNEEKREYDIKVIIGEITVDEDYFDIAYEVYLNGELKSAGGCGDDHEWGEDYKKLEESIRENPLPYVMEALDGDWD